MADAKKQPKEADLQAELDQLRRKLTLFAELTRKIAATLDPTDLLSEVVDAACQITGARYGALGVFDATGKIQDFITQGVSEEERAAIGDLPVGHGLLGLLQTSQQVVRLADLASHAASVGFPKNHPPMKSFLGAPVLYEGQPLGNLYLTEKEGGDEFSEEDERMLLLLADQAAMAIHNADLHAAAEAERGRYASSLKRPLLACSSSTRAQVVHGSSTRKPPASWEGRSLRKVRHSVPMSGAGLTRSATGLRTSNMTFR